MTARNCKVVIFFEMTVTERFDCSASMDRSCETHPASGAVVVHVHETARVSHPPLLRVDEYPREPAPKADVVAAAAPAGGREGGVKTSTQRCLTVTVLFTASEI